MPGVSGISIDGDVEAGQQYIPRAAELLRRLSERIELGGVKTASDFVRLADNAYVYATVAMGLKRAVIVVDTSNAGPSAQQTKRTPVVVPDFYSGAIIDGTTTTPPKNFVTGIAPPPYINNFWPTPACAALFKIPTSNQTVTRLAVDPYTDFNSVLSAPEGSSAHYSQYVKLKPTMYSGQMRQVVQLLMGFGRQNKQSIYDKTKPKLTTAKQDRIAAVPSQYVIDVGKNGLQIRYDWRWYRTHGIGVGTDGAFWLVEIGNTRGALAMPLPINTVSQMDAFRAKLEAMGDSAGITALNTLGAFPTGESIPADNLDSWIRAGRVVRLSTVEDLQDFYNLNAPSSAYGWAFNHSGNEAHNIGQDFAANGVLESVHYGYSFTIGATNNVDPPSNATAAIAAIKSKSSDPRYQAVVFKINRMPEFDLELLLAHDSLDPDGLFEDLDAYVGAPVATAHGHLWEESRGYLYKLGKLVQYEVKYPNPELGYLVSVDMQAPHAPPIPCDTDVHVFYIGDELKICRWFNDLRTAPAPQVTDDTDGCELIGDFTRTTISGNTNIPPMIYTTDYDDRRELNANVNTIKTHAVSLGYCQISCADDIVSPWLASCTRKKRYRRDITDTTVGGEGLSTALVVPFLDRCCYYYALVDTTTGTSVSTSTSIFLEEDPWYCNTWRNFPGYNAPVIGGVVHRVQHPDGCGPVDARTAASPSPNYAPYPCSDISDSGPWCHVCDNLDSMTYFIPPPPTPPPTSTSATYHGVRTTFIVNESETTPFRIEQRVYTDVFGGIENPWLIPSPDPATGDTQYAEVTHNVLGDGDPMRFSHEPNGGIDVLGAPLPVDFEHGSPTCIGVIS